MTATVTQPKKRRRFNRLWLLIPAALVIGGAVALIPRPGASSAAKPSFETAQATRSDYRVSVSGPGTLAALRTLDVKPQVAAPITLLPKVGDKVVKGQLLARLDSSTFQRNLETAQLGLEKAQASLDKLGSDSTSSAQSQSQSVSSAQSALDNAQNDLETARTNLSTQQKLFAVGGVSAQTVTDARTALKKAQNTSSSARVALQTAQSAVGLKNSSSSQDVRNGEIAVSSAKLDLQNARDNLANTKIYAPFTGRVSSVAGQVGGDASSGAALFTLIDDSSLELPVQVGETDIGAVKVGQKANLTLDAVAGNFAGTVVRVDPSATVSQNIAYFNATVRVSNADGALKPGMTAEGEIISKELSNVIQIPKRALEKVRNRAYVQVLGADGKTPTRKLVRVLEEDSTVAVIESGLEGGETLVLPTKAAASSTTGGGGFPAPGQ